MIYKNARAQKKRVKYLKILKSNPSTKIINVKKPIADDGEEMF